MLPEAIDHHPRQQRPRSLLRVGHPICQADPRIHGRALPADFVSVSTFSFAPWQFRPGEHLKERRLRLPLLVVHFAAPQKKYILAAADRGIDVHERGARFLPAMFDDRSDHRWQIRARQTG